MHYGVYGRLDNEGLKSEGLGKVIDSSYEHKIVEASVNYSPGEVERCEAGVVWKNNFGLSGIWNNYKSRGPC